MSVVRVQPFFFTQLSLHNHLHQTTKSNITIMCQPKQLKQSPYISKLTRSVTALQVPEVPTLKRSARAMGNAMTTRVGGFEYKETDTDSVSSRLIHFELKRSSSSQLCPPAKKLSAAPHRKDNRKNNQSKCNEEWDIIKCVDTDNPRKMFENMFK